MKMVHGISVIRLTDLENHGGGIEGELPLSPGVSIPPRKSLSERGPIADDDRPIFFNGIRVCGCVDGEKKGERIRL